MTIPTEKLERNVLFNDPINTMRVVCPSCKRVLVGNGPNVLKPWRDTGKTPTFNQIQTGIKYVIGLTDLYGWGVGGGIFHRIMGQYKIYAIFRHDHKDCRIYLMPRGKYMSDEVRQYSLEQTPSDKRIKACWNSLGDWIGDDPSLAGLR